MTHDEALDFVRRTTHAVLATINRRYKLKNSGIKITGLPA